MFYLNVNGEKVKVGIEQCANIHKSVKQYYVSNHSYKGEKKSSFVVINF